MYVDTFNLKGEKIPIRDAETRKIVDQLDNAISGTVGNSGLPIYLKDGEFKPCDSTLDVNITGEAQSAVTATHADTADSATHAGTADSATRADTADSATRADTADSATHAGTADSATHAGTADSATRADTADSANNANTANIATNAISATAATTAEKLNTSAGGNTRPVYFSGGKPVQCGSTLDIDISGNADSADKVTLNSTLSPPFIRIPIDTSSGRIYMLTGATTLNVNISSVYGNAFIGDFTIPIPLNVRLPHGYYSVQVTCQAHSRVVIPALHVATGLSNIVGWVESSISGPVDVLFYVFIMGY